MDHGPGRCAPCAAAGTACPGTAPVGAPQTAGPGHSGGGRVVYPGPPVCYAAPRVTAVTTTSRQNEPMPTRPPTLLAEIGRARAECERLVAEANRFLADAGAAAVPGPRPGPVGL